MMGEHFSISHNNYSDMSFLDGKKKKGGFPGFDILELIGILHTGDSITESEINDKNSCYICQYMYKEKQEPIEKQDPLVLSRSRSESSLLFCDSMDPDKGTYESVYTKPGFGKPEITDEELLNELNIERERETIPCWMLCCERSICKGCIQKHIQTTNKLRCPYCDVDHELSDEDYIVIPEANLKYNDSWDSWREERGWILEDLWVFED